MPGRSLKVNSVKSGLFVHSVAMPATGVSDPCGMFSRVS